MMTSANPEVTATPVHGASGKASLGVRTLFVLAIVGAAAAVAPYPRAALPLAALAAILCSIFLLPPVAGVASHVWGPVLGAAALLVVSHVPLPSLALELPSLSWDVVWTELTGHLGVPTLILAFAYLSLSLDDSGFFEWCSLKLMRAGRGSNRRLLVAVFLGVSVLTFFTSNDIVVLSVTPILIHLGNNSRIRNLVPLLMAEFIAANTASMGLYIGNPTNIVIGNAVGLGFVDYARRMCVPTLVATSLALLLVVVLFERSGIEPRYELPARSQRESWTRQMTVRTVLFGACLIVLSVFGNPWVLGRVLGVSDPTALRDAVSRLIVGVSVFFAALCLVIDTVDDRAKARRSEPPAGTWIGNASARWRRMPIDIVPFFLSFCIVLRAFDECGLTRYVVSAVKAAFAHGAAVGSLVSAGYAVLAVNLTNNIPATILFEKAWLGSADATPPIIGLVHGLGPRDARVFVDVSLFASNFGANLTFIGALAGLMWLRIIRDHAARAPAVARVPTARDFLLWGVVVVPCVTVATSLAIAWFE